MTYWLFNIGTDKNNNNWWNRLRDLSIIATGFDNLPGDEGERILKTLKHQDWLIAYSNGNGAVGAGRVGPAETYRLMTADELPIGYEQPNLRHWRNVDWIYFVEDISNGVSYTDLKLEGPPRRTRIDLKNDDNSLRIIDLLSNMTPSLRQIFPDDVHVDSALQEGSVRTITVNRYERNPDARMRCIEHWGYSCSVCDMNFLDRYGLFAKEFIHVHHLTPISQCNGKYNIDPIADLRPVCPNCHAMLHFHDPMLSIEQLRAIILRNGPP